MCLILFHFFLSAIHYPIGTLEDALKAVVPVGNVLRHARGDDHMPRFSVLLILPFKGCQQFSPVVVILSLQDCDELVAAFAKHWAVLEHRADQPAGFDDASSSCT